MDTRSVLLALAKTQTKEESVDLAKKLLQAIEDNPKEVLELNNLLTPVINRCWQQRLVGEPEWVKTLAAMEPIIFAARLLEGLSEGRSRKGSDPGPAHVYNDRLYDLLPFDTVAKWYRWTPATIAEEKARLKLIGKRQDEAKEETKG